jgi:hypothetical protein
MVGEIRLGGVAERDWNPEPLETLTEYVADAAATVARHGGRQALWMAEIGDGNYRDGSHVSAQTSALSAYEHTLDDQAVARTQPMDGGSNRTAAACYKLRRFFAPE